MADFRRSIPLLAVVALLLGSAVAVSAQVNPAFQCVANAGVPPLVRSEGLTELVGDLILNCTGGTPTPTGQQIPPVNIQIFLNTSVTSRILSGSLTEALLLLDDPGANNAANPSQAPCPAVTCTNIGNGAGSGYYSGGGGNNVNVFQGQLVGTNSLLWLGVPIDPPGSTSTRIIRITNVRANANALGVSGPNASPIPIIETISATGTFSVPINNPNQTVAFIQKGLSFSVSKPTLLQQCFSQTLTNVGTLTYKELFATAFKQFNVGSSDSAPTGKADQNNFNPSFNSETGFYNSAFSGTYAGAGLPDFGTRLKAVFNDVPTGVTLYVSPTNTTSGSDLARAVASEAGSYVAATVGTNGVVQVGLTAGTGQAVWEITQSNALAFATVTFNVYVSYTANPGAGSPALGTATVNGSYAPISTATTATTGPIPRFADTSTATNLFTINPCVTNLLFPFVTNQGGFDTGLAISSTSTDPFGTSPQSGPCTLNAYGANAPAAITTPVVDSGTTYTALASAAMPNFQGYVIAVCQFQYAHGFAFISDLGARNLAMGYLALIIPDPARTPNPFPGAGNGSGEQLGY